MRYNGRSPDGGGPSIVQVVLSLGQGGLETLAVDLACALKDRGLRPVLIALDEGGVLERRLDGADIEYVVLDGRRFWDIRFHVRLARLLRQLRTRVIHTHAFAPLLHSFPAVCLAWVKRVVHTEHSFEYLEPRRSLQLALRGMSWRVHRFTIVGQRMRDFFQNSVGVPARKIQVIVNGIEVAPRGSDDARARTRAELGLPSSAVLVGAVGRMAPVKNLDMLLRAGAVVRSRGTPIHLVLLGEGECRPALELLARELAIADFVSFLGWRTDVRRILDALDIYALTSVSEGLPLAMLEGMAAELPIVSTSVGDVPFLVRDGETGFLVAQDDVESFADRLRQLASEPALRTAMGKAARDLAVRSYDRTTMVQQYMNVYGL